MQDVQDMNDSSDDDITLDERVQMLNMDQKRIYEKVKMHLLHLLSHESEECSCDFKPLRMFVSGVGGTGKSFLIHALKSLIHKIWPCHALLLRPLDWQHRNDHSQALSSSHRA